MRVCCVELAEVGFCLVLDPPEAHPEARICTQVVHLGGEGDSRSARRWENERGGQPVTHVLSIPFALLVIRA